MTGDTAKSKALLTVSRGLLVLRAFRGERTPLSNSEIVARTGLPKSTVSRLTTTLTFAGYLHHAADGRKFELGAGSLSIGHAFLESSPLIRLAAPFMQTLANRLNVSAALAIPNELEMLYVAYGAGRDIATLRLGVGSMLPMATTAIGRAYLWALPADQQAHLFQQMEQRYGEDFPALHRDILESFAELDERGICLVRSGYQRGTYGVGAPIRVGVDQTLMSLNLGEAVIDADFEDIQSMIGEALRCAVPELEALLKDLEYS